MLVNMIASLPPETLQWRLALMEEGVEAVEGKLRKVRWARMGETHRA